MFLSCFVDDAFTANYDKIRQLRTIHPEVNIVPIDNSNNNGGRVVTVDEAERWDYSVNEELMYNLLEFIADEYESGRITKAQLSVVGRRIQEIEELTSDRTKQIADGLKNAISTYDTHEASGEGSSRLGLDAIDAYLSRRRKESVSESTANTILPNLITL